MNTNYYSDDEPFIDYIDGTFYQTNTYKDLCIAYAQNYYGNNPYGMRKYVNKSEFVNEFTDFVIENNIHDRSDFCDEAEFIFKKLACQGQC